MNSLLCCNLSICLKGGRVAVMQCLHHIFHLLWLIVHRIMVQNVIPKYSCGLMALLDFSNTPRNPRQPFFSCPEYNKEVNTNY